MDMSPQEYQAYVKSKQTPSPIGKNMVFAFLIGGAICTLGQGIQAFFLHHGLEQTQASTATAIVLIGLSALLTALNLYHKLARLGGAGTLVPITGFANAVASAGLEFRSEGWVTGLGTKIFVIAGPVVLYGTAASVVYGVFLMLWG